MRFRVATAIEAMTSTTRTISPIFAIGSRLFSITITLGERPFAPHVTQGGYGIADLSLKVQPIRILLIFAP